MELQMTPLTLQQSASESFEPFVMIGRENVGHTSLATFILVFKFSTNLNFLFFSTLLLSPVSLEWICLAASFAVKARLTIQCTVIGRTLIRSYGRSSPSFRWVCFFWLVVFYCLLTVEGKWRRRANSTQTNTADKKVATLFLCFAKQNHKVNLNFEANIFAAIYYLSFFYLSITAKRWAVI